MFNARRWRFTRSMIEDAPEWKGVYVLWSHDKPLAVGHARGGSDTIRSRLLSHFSHAAAPGMGEITHYSWEMSADPVRREAEVVEQLGLLRRSPAPERAKPTPANTEWPERASS